ncbi:MAG: restriction endonuclease subunit S [Burkholderiales bacterium]|nr:restriction endonuclease subunit S [Burkholderiales bacterium]
MSTDLQQTEIGELPAAWSVDRVDSAFDIQQGKQVSKRNRAGEHQRPFLRTKNVFWNRLELTDLDQMHFSEAEQTRLELQADDLLVCEGGSIGRTALWNNEVDGCLYQNHLHRLRAKGDKAHPQFGVYWLWYAFDVANLYFGRGNVTTIPNLSQSKLAELPMALPPLPEQKKIAHILLTVQRGIEAQERIIQATTELKKALMHKLFTEGLRNEPPKQTEIGPVPKSWKVVQFDKFVTLQRGHDLRKQDFRKGDVPVIGATQVIGYHDTANVKAPGVTVVRSGSSAGKPLFIPEDFWAHNVLLYVKDFQGNVPKFVYYKILALDLTQYRQGVAVPTLNRNTFSAIELALPSSGEQQEIADMLDAVGNKTDVAERKRDQLQDLFRTLLHELMTAKIRVHCAAFDV